MWVNRSVHDSHHYIIIPHPPFSLFPIFCIYIFLTVNVTSLDFPLTTHPVVDCVYCVCVRVRMLRT